MLTSVMALLIVGLLGYLISYHIFLSKNQPIIFFLIHILLYLCTIELHNMTTFEHTMKLKAKNDEKKSRITMSSSTQKSSQNSTNSVNNASISKNVPFEINDKKHHRDKVYDYNQEDNLREKENRKKTKINDQNFGGSLNQETILDDSFLDRKVKDSMMMTEGEFGKNYHNRLSLNASNIPCINSGVNKNYLPIENESMNNSTNNSCMPTNRSLISESPSPHMNSSKTNLLDYKTTNPLYDYNLEGTASTRTELYNNKHRLPPLVKDSDKKPDRVKPFNHNSSRRNSRKGSKTKLNQNDSDYSDDGVVFNSSKNPII